jgi:hypothetical protein
MFCPSCGSEERQPIQFCRSCGTNLRAVQTAIQPSDAITASAVTAREEIGRAIASRISSLERAKDLSKVAEEVLPEIEKFLESPEERRLRRIRAGVMTTAIGIGVTLFLVLFSFFAGKDDIPWPVGFVLLFIGLAMVLNGYLFTVPERGSMRAPGDVSPVSDTSQLQNAAPPRLMTPPPSVVDSTTNLLEQQVAGASGTSPASRKRRDTH